MKTRFCLLAGASILALASITPVGAADHTPPAQQTAQATSADADVGEEIVVTARRKSENLQEVPETVNAVTSQDISKYNITQLQDISKLLPTMTVSPLSGPTGGSGTMRGQSYTVSYNPESVQFYINDAPMDQAFQYMSMYDVGDIEILRGPQGVTRGKIAPVGAFTLTTHQPDLEKIGGYASATWGNQSDTNFQGAVGIPIVVDKFAIRVAAVRDDNADNEVRSIYNEQEPRKLREGGRVTARLAPTDDINATVSFQHVRQRELSYGSADYGPGNAAGGPPLTVDEQKTIEPGITNVGSNFNDIEGRFDWTFKGQKLEAVSGYSKYTYRELQDYNPIDQVPGLSLFDLPTIDFRKEFNEDVRISSAEPLFGGHFDYVAGFFYDHQTTGVLTDNPFGYLPGAFPGNNSVNYADIISPPLALPENQNENAIYATGTIHITNADEITAGIRHGLHEQHDIHYPGGLTDAGTYHPTIYNIEVSHKFNDDFLIWLRTGSAWRYGTVNPVLVLTTNGSPLYFPYEYPGAPETSKDYEGGIKGSLFDKRLTFDADYFHQHYNNFLGLSGGQAVYHLVGVPGPGGTLGTLTAQDSVFSLPHIPSATFDGIELSANAKVMKGWSVSGAFGWANGRASGALPCNPAGITSTSTIAAAYAALTGGKPPSALTSANVVNLCPGTVPTANVPKWNFNISSEYDHPINDVMQGFVRGLLNYHPSNPNSGFPGYTVPAYATLDLYIGVRQPDAQWEFSLYGKNLTNNRTILNIGNLPGPVPGIAALNPAFSGANSAGYLSDQMLPRRELGMTVRYAFGSG